MEAIKDRLAHIIRAKNLTATQFAEMMQIQPSNVSHILNGRNKPSLDFLIKLKDIFPEYSFDWIILGKKPITISERQSYLQEDKPKSAEPVSVENGYSDGLFSFVNEKTPEIQEAVPEKSEIDNMKKEAFKVVKQMILVYEDGTFEIYNSK